MPYERFSHIRANNEPCHCGDHRPGAAKSGADVDYALTWHENHGGDFDLPELFRWIDGLCRADSHK